MAASTATSFKTGSGDTDAAPRKAVLTLRPTCTHPSAEKFTISHGERDQVLRKASYAPISFSGIHPKVEIAFTFPANRALQSRRPLTISYSVTQRTQEIGVRMALGAPQGNVQLSVIGKTLRLALMGIAAGTLASLTLAKGISTLLFGTAPTAPLTFACMIVLLATVALRND